MNFLANKVVRQLIYFLVGLLGVVLFSFEFAQQVTATTPLVSFAQSPADQIEAVSLWRNPSHQEPNFYQ
ncbi:MAG TPA: hypothetical protein V6C57_12610 [Coleofasciculaceae cyanobacterium]